MEGPPTGPLVATGRRRTQPPMTPNPLADKHPDSEGFSCDGTLALEPSTGLFRCPDCGALADGPEGVVIGHGSEADECGCIGPHSMACRGLPSPKEA